ATEPEPEAGAIEGTIVARDLETSIGGPPTIRIKEDPADECGIVFVVQPSTGITYRGERVSPSRGDEMLTVGSRVRVSTSVVLRSWPGQATADAIDILSRP